MTTSDAYIAQKRLRSLDQLAEMFPAWELEVVQTEAGPASMNVLFADVGRYVLTHFDVDRKFHFHGRTPAGFRTFAIPACEQPEMLILGRWARHDQLILTPASREVEGVGFAGFNFFSLSLCREDLMEIGLMSGLEVDRDSMDDGGIFTPCAGALSRLRNVLWDIHASARAQRGELLPKVVEPVLEALASSLASSDERHEYPEPKRRDLVFKAVLKYMMGNLDTVSSVKELCEAGNVSERTLLYIFRDRLDVSPKEFLQACKLRQVQQDLLSGKAQSVTDAATRWGFWHMSQFAADYRRQFGELPSETLKRGGGR